MEGIVVWDYPEEGEILLQFCLTYPCVLYSTGEIITDWKVQQAWKAAILILFSHYYGHDKDISLLHTLDSVYNIKEELIYLQSLSQKLRKEIT